MFKPDSLSLAAVVELVRKSKLIFYKQKREKRLISETVLLMHIYKGLGGPQRCAVRVLPAQVLTGS